MVAPDAFSRLLATFSLVQGEARLFAWAMLGWFAVGVLLLLSDYLLLRRDVRFLADLSRRVEAGGNAAGVRRHLREWTDAHPRERLARWLRMVRQSGEHGSRLDAAALTDSIYGHEQDRHFWFRYVARSAILLGLLFTSVGLCLTLLSIAPAIRATHLAYDAWVAGVQTAMSQALGGMATSFLSSFLGILATLTLNFFGVFLTSRHGRYLAEVDAFLQGAVIPLYASKIAQGEQQLVLEAIRGVQAAIEAVGQQYAALKADMEDAERTREELDDLRKGLRHAVTRFLGGLDAFGEHAARLEAGSRAFEATGTTLRTALMEGLGFVTESVEQGFAAVAQAQAEGLARQEAYRTEVIEPFREALAERHERQQQLAETLLAQVRVVNEQAAQSHQAVARLVDQLDVTVDAFGGRMADVLRESAQRQETIVRDLGRASQSRVDRLASTLDGLLQP